MGLGGKSNDNTHSVTTEDAKASLQQFTWNEVKDNNKKLLVIDNAVYDIAKFIKKHPGGEKIMLNHIGEDASDAFTAFHTDMKKVSKYLKMYKIGELAAGEKKKNTKDNALMADFKELREVAEKTGCFKASVTFYTLHFLHILAFIAAAWYLLKYHYDSWLAYFSSALLLVTAQAQAGWLQHDFGHLSVFNSNKLNHLMHHIVLSVIKGVPCAWWNYRHFQHHAKPNVIKKDPDVKFGFGLGSHIFLVGKTIPKETGEKKKGILPYQHQHKYWFFTLPPLLMPVYFLYEYNLFMIKKKLYGEMAWTLLSLVLWSNGFVPLLGVFGCIKLYFLVRFIESHWFVWVTQMNHLPMNIEKERDLDWVRMQLDGTCNVKPSFFNDWFTGHLNFQIEHHLFPTMPRCNYYKIAPLVRSLCAKHNILYSEKSLYGAMADICNSLKESGEIWYDAYYN